MNHPDPGNATVGQYPGGWDGNVDLEPQPSWPSEQPERPWWQKD